jgi:ElaB/YqjD/DUF883 family membrane-anchored ribosome-binding protein
MTDEHSIKWVEVQINAFTVEIRRMWDQIAKIEAANEKMRDHCAVSSANYVDRLNQVLVQNQAQNTKAESVEKEAESLLQRGQWQWIRIGALVGLISILTSAVTNLLIYLTVQRP